MAEQRRTRSALDRRIDRRIQQAAAGSARRAAARGPVSLLTGAPDVLALETLGEVRADGTAVVGMALETMGECW